MKNSKKYSFRGNYSGKYGMFEHTLQLLHFLILKSKWLWKNQILLALYNNSELSRHLHSEKSPMSMTKWKLSRILTMGSKIFWSSISINSNTLRNSQHIFLSHFYGYSMCCSNSLGYMLGNHGLDKNSNKTSEMFWPHCEFSHGWWAQLQMFRCRSWQVKM